MKAPHQDQSVEAPSVPKKAGTEVPLRLLPSWLFFSEKITIEPGTTEDALREQAVLSLESFSPVPQEQLLTGFHVSEDGGSAICYAAMRERCRHFLENLSKETLHVIPSFALWEDDGVRKTPIWIWFATKEEITALKFVPDSPIPESVNSWKIPEPEVPEGATLEDIEREFPAMILALRQKYQSELDDLDSEQKQGTYIIGEQTVSPKTGRGEIHLDRVDPDGKRVPAARTLNFSLTGESLWLADIRDESVLEQEKRERKNRMILRNTSFALVAVALVLLVAQIVLMGVRKNVDKYAQIASGQAPQVREIQSQAKLIEDISKIQKNRLQMIRNVAVLNGQRPEGVGLTNFAGNGTTGILSVSGSAETISLANEFEKNVRSCGFFKNVSFVANISSTSANFSLQCSPIREKIATIDFYETEKPVEQTEESTEAPKTTEATSAEEGEETPDTEGSAPVENDAVSKAPESVQDKGKESA